MYAPRLVTLVVGLSVWCQAVKMEGSGVSNHVGSLQAEGEGDNSRRSSPDQLAAILDKMATKISSLDRNVAELKNQVAQLLNRPPCPPAQKKGRTKKRKNKKKNKKKKKKITNRRALARELRVKDITKVETFTSYNVTVNYLAPEQPEVSLEMVNGLQYAAIEHHEFGMVRLRVNNTGQEWSALWLELSLPRESLKLLIRMSKNSTDKVQFPIVKVKTKPEPNPDIAYWRGTDVTFQIHVISEDVNRTIAYLDYDVYYLTQSKTEDHVVNAYKLRHNEDRSGDVAGFHLTDISHSSDKHKKILNLHLPFSSSERISGVVVIRLITSLNCSNDCLVDYYFMDRFFPAYPLGMFSPFPRKYVGFVKYDRETDRESDGGTEIQLCQLRRQHQNCRVSCAVAGHRPEVYITKADHDRSPSFSSSSSLTHFNSSRDFLASAYVIIANVTVEKPVGLYRCHAVSRHGGHVITKTMTLNVTWPAEFLPGGAQVEAFANGTVLAKCTARGFPTPIVTFHSKYLNGTSSLLDDADVTVTQPDKYTSQATLWIQDLSKYPSFETHDVFCSAERGDGSSVEQYVDLTP